jgi:hypothetical protein
VTDRPFPLNVFLPIPEERNRFFRSVVTDRPFPLDGFLPIPEERNRFYRFFVTDKPFPLDVFLPIPEERNRFYRSAYQLPSFLFIKEDSNEKLGGSRRRQYV